MFLNSENSKSSGPCRLLLNLANRMGLRGSEKHIVLSNLDIYHTWGNVKKSNNNKKYQLQHEMKSSSYLTDQIPYQIFKIILSISLKHERVTDNPPIRICVNKIKNKIIIYIKTEYYLELLTSEYHS